MGGRSSFLGSPFCQETLEGWCSGNPGPVSDTVTVGPLRQQGRCQRVNAGGLLNILEGPARLSRGQHAQGPSVARAGLTARERIHLSAQGNNNDNSNNNDDS